MDDPFALNAADGNTESGRLMRTMGCISGTSMDAIDVALLETDGEIRVKRLSGLATPYREATRRLLREAMKEARAVERSEDRTDAMQAAEEAVTVDHGDAIAALIERTGAPDIVGWHGQTIYHAPQRGVSVQLGDADTLAKRLKVPVISQFRLADLAAGGQGAPLVPIYHAALLRTHHHPEPALVLNLGGVANITYIDDATLLACDTGPANAMIDDLVAKHGWSFDNGGAIAAAGKVDAAALAQLLDDPFFSAPPPKSLDRDAFSAAPVDNLAFNDAVATLTRFSADAIAATVRTLPAPPQCVIACGGGVHNRTLLKFIADALSCPVMTAEEAGFSADFMEAEAFAYLAVRSEQGLPLTYPGTTGVPEPLTGGRRVPSPAPQP